MSMEKFSLDAFERYPMVRCRPQETEAENTDQFVFHTCVQPQEECSGSALIEVRGENLADVHAYGASGKFLGFTVKEGEGDEKLFEAAVQAFPGKKFFVPVRDSRQVKWAMETGTMGGLLVDVGSNPYDACECMARQGLQRMYRKMPVLVRGGCGEKGEDFARQWHASRVENLPGSCAGWRIALRRLTYPKAVTSDGYVPMRFWWTNRGPAPMHEPARVKIRLSLGEKKIPLALSDSPLQIPLGDRTYNEIVWFPDLPSGVYLLEFGLFQEDDTAVSLCHTGCTADGWYPAGEMIVDTIPRPEYEHIWDDYYADGYYPLVDPPVPGT